MIWELFEWVALILFLVVVVTQLAIPMYRGTPLFPVFRRERELETELERARQTSVESRLEKRIARERRDIRTEKK